MSNSYQKTANMLVDIAKDLGVQFHKGIRILDFGCGQGDLVSAFRVMQYEAYGVDIKSFWINNTELKSKDWFRVSKDNPYNLPFENDYFDFITSTSVFEHVQDYEQCFREIHRVLKPGGSTMHQFPGPWVLPVEPHIFVPFASMIQSDWWLSLWAFLGIRNGFQKDLGWREVVRRNKEYCKNGINYLPRRKVKKMILEIFGNVLYPKKEYIRHSPGGAGRLGRLLPIPGYPNIIFSCREQVIFMKKERSTRKIWNSGEQE